jgi:hypothetical protein
VTIHTTTPHADITAAADTVADEADVARRLVAAIVDGDEPALATLLAPDVWLRAMLVREVVEAHDAQAALACFQHWFGGTNGRELQHASTAPAAGSRHHVRYRFRLRPSWAPQVWHVIEQSGYARVRAGRVARLDLVCTGYDPEG